MKPEELPIMARSILREFFNTSNPTPCKPFAPGSSTTNQGVQGTGFKGDTLPELNETLHSGSRSSTTDVNIRPRPEPF